MYNYCCRFFENELRILCGYKDAILKDITATYCSEYAYMQRQCSDIKIEINLKRTLSCMCSTYNPRLQKCLKTKYSKGTVITVDANTFKCNSNEKDEVHWKQPDIELP